MLLLFLQIFRLFGLRSGAQYWRDYLSILLFLIDFHHLRPGFRDLVADTSEQRRQI